MAENSTNVRTSTEGSRVSYGTGKPSPWLGRISKINPALAGWLGVHWFTRPRHWPRPERETHLLAGATPLSLSNGVRAWSFGAGPLAILVHGWEGRGAQLGAFVEPLVRRGFRVVTFDVRGHGSSSGTHATILSWLDPLFELSERFGEPCAIIAHSFGCPAVSLALRRGLATQSLVYLAPPDALDLGAKTFARVTGLGDRGEQALKARVGARTGLRFEDQRVEHFGSTMNTPLLVVHDETDADVSFKCAQTYVHHWPGCQVFTTSGLGHRKILHDPTVVEHVVGFVDGHRHMTSALDRWFTAAYRDVRVRSPG